MASGFLLWISSLALILFLFSAAVASEPAIPFYPTGQASNDRIEDVRKELGDGEQPGIGPAVVRVVNSRRKQQWQIDYRGGEMPASEEFVFRRLVDVQRVQEEGGVANYIVYRTVVGYYDSRLGTIEARAERRAGEIISFGFSFVENRRSP
ncbi:hypothetical protein AXF42_Ash017834 [Apostasia shenzhenica]|uniref:Uncharacterized protein n=1 Tax=Apostasia shenzhenica TaxID=1088818 RepID=A0A2I0A3X5_9ASPA|nr:hypothetical protein AXF42_Ash017834 [Apostasia shenzhenica]